MAMNKGVQVVAFSGGVLRRLDSGERGREAVLALPLSRMLVKMVLVPEGGDPVETATPILKAMSPYPDEPITVSCETVRETPAGTVVIAAALPEGAAEDIATALDEAKLNVVRVDSIALGAIRGLWPDIMADGGEGRKLLVLKSPDGAVLVVMDGTAPSSIRAVADGADMKRETMFSLLEAEDFNGSKPLAATIERDIDIDAALAGVAERTDETGSLNAIPDSWLEVLEEARFKKKLFRGLAVAGGIWLLAMAVLFGVPVAYDFMTDRTKDRSRAHAKAYAAVSEKRAKVKLVRQYSDHARGALETMRAVAEVMPDGMTLTSWEFSRDDGLRIRGESDDTASIYMFKDRIVDIGGEDDPVFKVVEMGQIGSQKGGRHKFDLDCRYEEADE